METRGAEHVLERSDAPYLVTLGINDLPHVWSAVEPVLKQACDDSRGEFSIPQILHRMGIETGVADWFLLAIIRGEAVQAVMVACVTVRLSGERVLDCLLASGEDAKQWPLVDPQFDEIARALGCTSVRIPFARKGWLKTLPHWRLVATGYVLEREI